MCSDWYSNNYTILNKNGLNQPVHRDDFVKQLHPFDLTVPPMM